MVCGTQELQQLTDKNGEWKVRYKRVQAIWQPIQEIATPKGMAMLYDMIHDQFAQQQSK